MHDLFAKLVLLLLVVVTVGCVLLSLRQQRFVISHEMAMEHQRIRHHQQLIWRHHASMIRHASPPAVSRAMERLAADFQTAGPLEQALPELGEAGVQLVEVLDGSR